MVFILQANNKSKIIVLSVKSKMFYILSMMFSLTMYSI